MELWIGLILLGLGIGICGTLIGAGGGFILMPILLLMYTQDPPETLTAISLAVVFFNAASGSIAYGRMKRIDYRAGLLFAVAGIPGAIAGAYSTSYIPITPFHIVFGLLLMGSAMFLFFSRPRSEEDSPSAVSSSGNLGSAYNRKLGMGISFFVGYLSSLLGIGGGILHVPILARVLKFPVHIATATSHFVLAILALVGSLVNLFSGHLTGGFSRLVSISLGVMIGAQWGAILSRFIHGQWIIRILALALAFVGIRILVTAFHGS